MTLEEYSMILRNYGVCDSDVNSLVNTKKRFLNECLAIVDKCKDKHPLHDKSYIKQIEAIEIHYKKEENQIFSKYGIYDWRKRKNENL